MPAGQGIVRGGQQQQQQQQRDREAAGIGVPAATFVDSRWQHGLLKADACARCTTMALIHTASHPALHGMGAGRGASAGASQPNVVSGAIRNAKSLALVHTASC